MEGRVAVVTGGAGGIGRAVCAGLAAAGARVAVLDVVGAEEAAAAMKARAYAVDVSDPYGVADVVARIGAELGPPAILVTLAGGSLGTPPGLTDVTPSDMDAVLDVNVKGTFYACQAVAPLMAAAGGGSIVTCSSIGARQPSPVTGVPYAAAKAAILGLTRKLARELGPAGIRVNAVAPGLFLTERLRQRFDAMSEAERREVLDAIPLGRMPELREIADPILFLAGDGASFITGAVLDVNGGRYMPA
jgi:3-oxoacyl-[acyl-carrier protein] reductase